MELILTDIEKENLTTLIYCFDKAIDIFQDQIDNNEDKRSIFMCSIANKLESDKQRKLFANFILNHRPYFNYFVSSKYSHEIINSNHYSVFLCTRPPFNTISLNNIRIHFMNHIFEILKNK